MAENERGAEHGDGRPGDLAGSEARSDVSREGARAGQTEDASQGRLADAYERIIARFNDRSDSLSREGLERELDEAVAFESEVEAFTRDELAILRAWVERDVSDFRRYLASGGESLAGFLGIDLDALSERLRTGLLSIADRTTVDQMRFEDELEAARADYTEGEIVAPGRMSCVHCDHPVVLRYRQLLEPCHACGHRYFQRAGR